MQLIYRQPLQRLQYPAFVDITNRQDYFSYPYLYACTLPFTSLLTPSTLYLPPHPFIMSTTTLTLTCHCHLNTLLYTPPPTTPLPLPSFYSHHPTYTTLLSSPLVLLTPIPTPPILAIPGLSPTSLTTLKTTHLPNLNTSVTFCPTCGATFYLKTPSTYLLAAGCIETTNLRQWLKPEKHIGLESAVLSGLQSVWDDGLPRYADMEGTVEYKPGPNQETGAQDAGELEGSCGCGAVTFTIPRPPPGWEQSSPYKDWCKPHVPRPPPIPPS